MKAVIDTSVYLSTLLSPRGVGAWLMALWRERRFEPVVSPALYAELVDVLARPDVAPRIEPQRKVALLRRLRADATWTPGELDASGALPDPHDDFLISAALESTAEFILTWDELLLKQGTAQGVQIVSLDQFVSLVVRTTANG